MPRLTGGNDIEQIEFELSYSFTRQGFMRKVRWIKRATKEANAVKQTQVAFAQSCGTRKWV